MGKQSWKAGNMLNPVPAVMVSVADQNHRPNIITVAWAGKFDITGTGLIMYSHGEYFALGKKLGKFGYSVQKKKK